MKLIRNGKKGGRVRKRKLEKGEKKRAGGEYAKKEPGRKWEKRRRY